MAKQALELEGQLTLELSERNLSATVTFTKASGHELWTADRLLDLMREKGITEGFSPDEVRRLFELADKKPSPYTFTAAEGTPPTDPVPEQIEWEEIAVPDDLAEQAEKIVSKAGPPEITLEIKQKIKREKTVTKKAILPFMKPKQETVTVSEQKVEQKRVYVDQTVQRMGYVTDGQKLGTVQPKEDGVGGQSVTGELVPPQVLADPLFYQGKGVARKRDELFAEYAGFVRIGPNWLDVVPFEAHDWEVSLSDDKATCYLSFDPGHQHAQPPTAGEIRSAAEGIGFPGESLVDDDEIARIVAGALETGTAVERVPINHSRDASFDIYVDEAKLTAVLNVYKGKGRGSPLRLKELGAAIKQSKLVGLDFEKIRTDINAFYKSPETDLIGYVLAEGKAPVSGPPRTAEYSVRFLDAEETAELRRQLQERDDTLRDCESAEAFPLDVVEQFGQVEREQRILVISPPVAGTPGVDVYGQTTPAPEPEEPKLELYEGVERTESIVVSTVAGLLHQGWKDNTHLLRVVPHADAAISIRVADNKMSATLNLSPPAGTGKQLSWDDLQSAITEAGVSRGVNEKLLQKAIERAQSGTPVKNVVFARGKHPANTGEAQMRYLIQVASGNDVTIREDGRADYRNQDRITTVTAGTKIAEITVPDAAAENGWDVLGNELSAQQGEEIAVDTGANVRLETGDNGNKILVADADGELIIDGNRFEIRAAHAVNGDVDYSSGNVKFPGTVTVKGSVRSGFYVMAGGDVQITEIVEASLLSAEGNIVINQGVKGAGKAVLRSKGDIGFTFAEQATILAVGNVQARNSLVHCKVKCNGKVRLIGDKGNIVGGTLQVRHGLETHNLGSERGAHTHVSFGQNYLIADQIEREEVEIEKLKREVTKLDLALKDKQRSGDQDAINKLHGKKLALLKTLEKRGLRVFTLRERFEEHFESEVVIHGSVYPGVVLESHGRELEITTAKKNVAFTFDRETGRIEETGEKE